jgi:hypothetical protein
MIEFAPLLTLEVTHAYYGGRCFDFDYTIPAATERLFAGGRLRAKARDGQLTVLYEKGEGGSPLAPLAGRTLQFGMKLLNSHFSNFTELPALPAEGLPLYRNSGADPAVLEGPVALLLDPANEVDAELLRAGLFCVIEIELDPGFYTAPPGFAIEFDAREETLKYYVVARNYTNSEFNQLDVTDAGFTADARSRIDFSRVAASSFAADDIPPDLLGGAEVRVVLFRSQQLVARQEKARRRIQLARNNDVIIAQLPQPGAAAATANLVVHLSK